MKAEDFENKINNLNERETIDFVIEHKFIKGEVFCENCNCSCSINKYKKNIYKF